VHPFSAHKIGIDLHNHAGSSNPERVAQISNVKLFIPKSSCEDKKKPPVAIIAAGVAAAVLLLIGLVVLWRCSRPRRPRRDPYNAAMHGGDAEFREEPQPSAPTIRTTSTSAARPSGQESSTHGGSDLRERSSTRRDYANGRGRGDFKGVSHVPGGSLNADANGLRNRDAQPSYQNAAASPANEVQVFVPLRFDPVHRLLALCQSPKSKWHCKSLAM
jgi:hypothetical protein